jgi:hypothetical protein
LIPGTRFSTTSPAFVFLGAGILVVAPGAGVLPAVGAAAGGDRPPPAHAAAALFVYSIHVELVYGAWLAR